MYGAPQPRLGADGSWIAMFPAQPLPSATAERQQNKRMPAEPHNNMQLEVSSSVRLLGAANTARQDPDGIVPIPFDNAEGTVAVSGPGMGTTGTASPSNQGQGEQGLGLCECCGQPQDPDLEQIQYPCITPSGLHPFHTSIVVTRGVLGTECAAVMRKFFRSRRAEATAAKAKVHESRRSVLGLK